MHNNESAFQFMTEMLAGLIKKRGSDLFVTVGFPPAMKVDGEVLQVAADGLSEQHTQMLVNSVMNDKQKADYERDRECNFALVIPAVGRFRINVFTQQGMTGMVARTIPAEVPTLDGLELPSVLKEISMTKRGLVVVVGGTGAGKSTTLAAMLNHRNQNSKGHIVTLEDPIEFVHPHLKCVVTQREVGLDTKSWESGLKNALRQAPDVVLMGEIRDREAMGHALDFAETGHLCLATLHATSTNQAVDRMVNFFPHERHAQVFKDLSLNLRAMISQRLLQRRASKGRTAAVEVLLNTPLMSDLIQKGEVAEMKDLIKRSREAGMQTFDQALFDLHEAQAISFDEGVRYADSKNDFRLDVKLRSKVSRTADLMADASGLSMLGEEPR